LAIELLIESKEFGVELENSLFEVGGGRSNICCSVGDLVEGINAVDVGTNQVVFPLQSVFDEVLKFLHLNLDNDLVDALLVSGQLAKSV